MNYMEKQINLTVFYDGLCKVCNSEINHYKKQNNADQIKFVDICSAEFLPDQEGLDPYEIHKTMHAKLKNGTIVTRVDAFIEIWKILPKYNWLARMASQKSVNILLDKAYTCFTLIRPLLPRYSNPKDCQDSPYCQVKNV
jgi:predicted DCC family thiol-disulfide oxidoreductase YuxK